MKVKECMSSEVCFVKPESTIKEVASLMNEKHIGCLPVCNNENEIVGIVTDRDIILRSIACDKDVNQTPVSDIMTTDVTTISIDSDIDEVSKIMCDCQIKRIPVIENNKIVGIVTLRRFGKK